MAMKEDDDQCLSPDTPFNFAIDTEWGEMEDFEEMSARRYSSASWFDVRVIYLRVTGCVLEDAPESLTMRFPARSIGVALEVNGGWISPAEAASVGLRRDRVDTEVTYVSTDSVRMSETVAFEVFHKEDALVSGSLERGEDEAWGMTCCCVVGKSGCAFLKTSSRHAPPAVEVSVVGRHLDTPVFLTQTVHLIARRKSSRALVLDVIPETEELGKSHNDLLKLRHQRDAFTGFENATSFSDFSDKFSAGISQLDDRLYSVEGEDGQMTWFNAGVRVGVGIGLGMCLGAGIGIGLMVRTYQVTTRTLRRVI